MVIPRGPIKAKGLLLAAIRDKDPCIVFEPKIMYRAAEEQVPKDDYVLPIGKADILREGWFSNRFITVMSKVTCAVVFDK